jgi:hypothetical protein
MLPVLASGAIGMLVLPIFYSQYVMLLFGPLAVVAASLASPIACRSRALLLVLALAGALQAWIHAGGQTASTNSEQWQALQEMHAHSDPTDHVISGWRRQFPFRYSAGWRFFYNEEVCPTVSDAERRALLDAVTSDERTRLVSAELGLCLPDPALVAALEEHFRPGKVPLNLIRD